MADRMVELAIEEVGFSGMETLRNENGEGIAASYWESAEAIADWKANGEHLEAQRIVRRTWYSEYHIRIAQVERAYRLTSWADS